MIKKGVLKINGNLTRNLRYPHLYHGYPHDVHDHGQKGSKRTDILHLLTS